MLEENLSHKWLIALTILSAMGSAGLIALAIYDVFTPSTYYYYYACLALPIMSIFIVTGLVFILIYRPARYSVIPLWISLLSIAVAFGLARNAPQNDRFFQWQNKQYDQAVAQILTGELQPSPYGRVALPNMLAFLSTTGDAVVQKDGVGISIFFDIDAEDGSSWGFLYLSDIRLAQGKANCKRWHDFSPRVENWIFCEVYNR